MKTLVIFLKEPVAGRAKTRLGREIGMTAAAWWYRHQTARLLRHVARDPRWRTVLAVSPDREGLTSRIWPPNLVRWPQGRGDLGDRMRRAFLEMPPGPVIIIGSDIPGITPARIARAFHRLGSADAVIGPSPDGGYWLIGLKRGAQAIPAGLFQGVRWSSPETTADTLASLKPLAIAQADTLGDVDTAADL